MTSARELIVPVYELARTYGARGLVRRALHETLMRTRIYDWLERAPVAAPPSPRLLPLDRAAAARVLAAHPDHASSAVARATAILAGQYPYFTDLTREAGWPPRWHHHPITGVDWSSDRHWTTYAHASPSDGDIKWLWEPSRFGFGWLFPRAWSASHDRRFADETWRGLRDWLVQNPWGQGANWYCAQELSFRCFAMLFAASAFAPEGLLPAQDRSLVSALLHVAARRIDRTLEHSLSQRNNHALSEAMALWTLSYVFPASPSSTAWRTRAMRALSECVEDQFATDGAYIQESLNYHRLAIHVLLWGRFVARSFGAALPDAADKALRRSHSLLHDLVPADGGAMPNYGHNDGALLLALSSSDHRDFRPTLVHLSLELGERPMFPPGPWDEQAAWFGLVRGDGAQGPRRADSLSVTSSGYVASHRGRWMIMARVPCHTRHRPGQADALHVDVWHGDRNVALDPGSFAYSEPAPWNNALAETRVHNTCSVGARSQMRRRGRFLWTDWSKAKLLVKHEREGVAFWMASVRCAWGTTFVHTRLVRHSAHQVDVLDSVAGAVPDVLRLHWNLDGTKWRREGQRWEDDGMLVTVESPGGRVLDVRGDPTTNLGWVSPTYGLKIPCTAIEIELSAERAWFHTVFSRAASAWQPLRADVQGHWQRGDLSVAASLLMEPP